MSRWHVLLQWEQIWVISSQFCYYDFHNEDNSTMTDFFKLQRMAADHKKHEIEFSKCSTQNELLPWEIWLKWDCLTGPMNRKSWASQIKRYINWWMRCSMLGRTQISFVKETWISLIQSGSSPTTTSLTSSWSNTCTDIIHNLTVSTISSWTSTPICLAC